MKTLSEKEFNEFNAKGLFTDEAEKAKKALFPVMQEIRKYIPGAEYGYRVIGGEYPEFYGVQIEFTQNGIRFHVSKIYKENKYKIAADMEHFKNVNRYDIERVTKQYEKPCNIGTFTAKKVNDWINYYTSIYNQVAEEDTENTQKVAEFLKDIENETIRWEKQDHSKGTITRNGLRFTFYIEEGHLSYELSLNYRGTADYNTFRLIADNLYIPKGNY